MRYLKSVLLCSSLVAVVCVLSTCLPFKMDRSIAFGQTLLVADTLPTQATVTTNGITDVAEMTTFFDGVMLSNMTKHRIPGVVVAVVKDGEIFFSKGYGYADVENQIAVNPDTSLFRIGSTSKVFTATAVMQLVEQGKLDLDTDINTYLDFEIPDTYDEPITLAHLLSHTAGFEDRGYEIWAKDAASLVPLGEWLKEHPHARVRPVGTIASYSNYGMTLAGYIVERVSGLSYDDYIDQYILQPLAMEHASAQQPLPAALTDQMADGYTFASGQYVAQDFETLNIAPAGAITATATDMTHFMIAHLQDGQYGEAQILKPETAQLMHSQLFTHDERIPGMAYGFWETEHNGRRLLGHGGDTFYFHSALELLPDENIGVFVSCNSQTCGGFPALVFNTFMDHYYPVAETALVPTTDFAERADLIIGTYRSNRRSYTTAEKLGSLMAPISIKAEDGELVISGAVRYVEIEPFLFHQVDGPGVLAFRQNEKGEVTHAYFAGQPNALERVPAADTMRVNLFLLGFSLLIFLSVIIFPPIIFFARWGIEREKQPLLARVARGTLAGLAVACVMFIVLVFIVLMSPQTVTFGQVPMLGLWQPVFTVIVVLALASVGFTVLAWKERYWGLVGRMHFTLVALAMVPFIWFVNNWHLLSW